MKMIVDASEVIQTFDALAINDLQKAQIRRAIRQALNTVKKRIQQEARTSMQTDPRKARQAVKLMIYKRVLGGNVSILNPRSTSSMAVEGSHSTGGVSGIRRRRNVSSRTRQINAYRGKDRAFILRFINAGTSERSTRFGRRGSIAGRNFFATAARPAMQEASRTLAATIERMIIDAADRKR
jgi:hypothetical protein